MTTQAKRDDELSIDEIIAAIRRRGSLALSWAIKLADEVERLRAAHADGEHVDKTEGGSNV